MTEDTPVVMIERRLQRIDPATREPVTIDQAEIAGLGGPVVILGDPGLGKSILTRALGDLDGFVYVRAASFVRHAHPETLTSGGECLVIDGLDEIASATVGGGVDAILTQLSKLKYPRFILSSREADWRGAADRIKIEEDYAARATLLHLTPLDRDDAQLFLTRNFSNVDAIQLLGHLADRGLDDIYKNPLTLRLIAEVSANGEQLPGSRAELLKRACDLLAHEVNPHHLGAAHANADAETLLLGAGAHAAALLLCDHGGIYTGPVGQTPEGYLHVSAITALPHAEYAEAALRTRLFEAEGENRFRILHRLIAEYLGAKWLAHCFRKGVSKRRLIGLFGQGSGVPTSLRGLHAWIAHFDHVLAETCIDADPYAVLRYGDAETMPVELARRLLGSLALLSARDPYFRAEDWGRHPASGLMRIELKADILALIGEPKTHTHLAILLLEAMEGSRLTAELAPELGTIMFDPARYYAERMRAADALRVMGAFADPAPTIERLLAEGSEDAQRLAWELLAELGIASVGVDLFVRTFYAHIGLTVSKVSGADDDQMRLAHLADDAIQTMDEYRIRTLLDAATDYGEPLFDEAGHSAKAQVADLVRLAGLRMLRQNPVTPPAEIWRRLHWIDHPQGYKRETTNALIAWFGEHVAVRRAIQAHVLFDAGYENVRDASFAFHESGLGLYPSEPDILALIEEYRRRLGGATPDLETLEDLVLLAPRRPGISADIRSAAARIAEGDGAFLAKLDELAKPLVYDWEEKEAAAKKEREDRIEKIHKGYRDDLTSVLPTVDAGAPSPLYTPANVYLGRHLEFDKQAAPEERVRTFLGSGLAERVLDGFISAFRRNDLPTAQDIVDKHLERRVYFAEAVLIAGTAEHLRRGLDLAQLPLAAREAAFMAWRRSGEAQVVGGVDLKPLEAAILTDDAAIERFFRTSIEPQLANNAAPHVYDLYFLANDARWPELAGRLAVEWLRRFPALSEIVEAELLNCAVRHAPLADLRQLARDTRGRVHRSYSSMLAWLSLDFLVDFEATRDDLVEAATDDPEFLWFVRNRSSGERNDVKRPLSVDQHVFMVEQFSAAWPKTPRPSGPSSGDTNIWDAGTAIETSGYALGAARHPRQLRPSNTSLRSPIQATAIVCATR